MNATPSLIDEDLPPLYRSSDQSSLAAQNNFLLATKCRLMLGVSAALFGGLTWKLQPSQVDIAGVLAAICFFGAMLVELLLLKNKPERTWYEGRAAAESLKTLSWRYAVGGQPFVIAGPPFQADELLLGRMRDVLNDLRRLPLQPTAGVSEQITPAMRSIRKLDLENRKQIYLRNRIADQQVWYATKSNWNRAQSSRWSKALLFIEMVGLIGAILKATGLVSIDMLGFAGAGVAALTAWLQTKQHENLGTAYAVASHELGTIQSKVHSITEETEWSRFVDESEEAISREHTMWKASRGTT